MPPDLWSVLFSDTLYRPCTSVGHFCRFCYFCRNGESNKLCVIKSMSQFDFPASKLLALCIVRVRSVHMVVCLRRLGAPLSAASFDSTLSACICGERRQIIESGKDSS